MHLTLLTLIAALATTISANPHLQPRDLSYPDPDPRFENTTLAHPGAEVHIPHLTRRGEKYYGIYECKSNFFKGECHWTEIKKGNSVCINKRWPGTYLGSMGPDKGVTCDCFDRKDCKFQETPFKGLTWPGVGDCPNYFGFKKLRISDCPSSYRCSVTD